MLKKFFTIFILLMLFASFAFAELPEEYKKEKKQVNKSMTTGDYKKIALNNIEMWFSNNGTSSYNPFTKNWGLMFPKNNGGVVYIDGPILSGLVGDNVRIQGSVYHNSSLQAGPVIEDVDPSDPQYRIYMIRKDWRTLQEDIMFDSGPNYTKVDYSRDYNEWPIDMGAPYEILNGNRVPRFIGDEQAWYVMNNLNPDPMMYSFYGTTPSRIEWQALVWAYNTDNSLANVIFKKYTIINKGTDTFEDAYFNYLSDPDIGYQNDDLIGCDTVLKLGFAYNGIDSDVFYGITCPAVGYTYLQGPTVKSDNPNDVAIWNFNKKYGYKNLPMTAFTLFILAHGIDVPVDALELYELSRGNNRNGYPLINIVINEPTTFLYSGDPVTGTGWIDGGNPIGISPRDVNFMLSSGPFKLAVGDTQEIVIGIVVGQGVDRLSSITVMKNYTILAQKAYDDFCASTTIVVNKPKEIPTTYGLSQNYPNPFNPTTNIQFIIPKDEYVKLTVYDITGRVVKELVNGHKVAGTYNIEFNASNHVSGTYYYKLEAGEYKNIRKMMLIK